MPGKRPVNSWVERTLRDMTPRQRGYFSKRRLLPFTTARDISERAHVPYSLTVMLLRQLSPENKSKPHTRRALFDFYRRMKRSGPARNWVLELPRFWFIRTIEKMAPHAIPKEIHEELMKHAAGRPVPSINFIYEFIRLNGLRTKEEQVVAIAKANSKFHRVRVKNRLSKGRRRQLLFMVYPLLEKWIKETIIPKDEMISLVFSRLENEVMFFDPKKINSNESIAVKWKKFVRSRVGFMMIDAIRKKFGRKKKKVRILSMLPDEVESPAPLQESNRIEWSGLIKATKPGTMQRKIINLLSKGYTRRKVALLLKISPQTMTTHLRNLRKRVGLPTRAKKVV